MEEWPGTLRRVQCACWHWNLQVSTNNAHYVCGYCEERGVRTISDLPNVLYYYRICQERCILQQRNHGLRMGESAISVRQRESYKETSSGTRGDCIVRDATLLLKTSRMEWEFVSSVSRTNRFRFFPRGSMRGYARFCHNIGNGL